eukprot:6919830-Prymnesium_polylepis.1
MSIPGAPTRSPNVLQKRTAEETSVDASIGIVEKKQKSSSIKRKAKGDVIEEQAATIAQLKSDLQKLNRRLKGGAEGELIYKTQHAEELRMKRENEYRCRIKSKQDEVVKLANLCTHIAEKRARAAEQKLVTVQRQLDRQTGLVAELEQERDARVDAD